MHTIGGQPDARKAAAALAATSASSSCVVGAALEWPTTTYVQPSLASNAPLMSPV